jgi:hypothetical protein
MMTLLLKSKAGSNTARYLLLPGDFSLYWIIKRAPRQ